MINIIVLLLISVTSHAQVFTNQQYTLTSFPNISKKGSYSVSSYNMRLEFSEAITLSPMTKIEVFGKQYTSMFVVEEYQIISEPLFFLNPISDFRIFLTQQLFKHSSVPNLTLALILGNKSFLSDDLNYLIKSSGLAHVFALSGLHMAIFLGICSFLFFRNIRHRYLGIALFLPAMLFLFLGGMGVSLQRAFLFYLIWAISRLIRIPLPSEKVFLVALFLSLLISPSNLSSVSFLLSFSAVYGLIFIAKYAINYEDSKFNYVHNIIVTSFYAGIFVLPILVIFFKEINISSFFASMLVVPIMPFVIFICLGDLLLSMLNVSYGAFSILLEISHNYIMFIAELFAVKFPLTVIFASPKIALIFTILIYCLLGLLIWNIQFLKKGAYYDQMDR